MNARSGWNPLEWWSLVLGANYTRLDAAKGLNDGGKMLLYVDEQCR